MTVLLRGATLIDGTGGDPRPAMTVVLEGNRVVETHPSGGPAERQDAVCLDLDGLTVLPGLIDAHAHFGLVEFAPPGTTPVAVLAARIFRNCELALDAGFTTVRDTGGIDGGVRQVVELGLVRGPRIFPSGPILCQSGGHGDFSPPFLDHHAGIAAPGLVQPALVCDGPEQVRVACRTVFRRGATQIKVAVSGGMVSQTDRLEDTQFTVEELQAAVAEAVARETYVTAHAHNCRSIRNGLEAGVACFEHGTFLDEGTAAAMASAGAVLVPTLTVVHLMAREWQHWGIPEAAVARVEEVEQAMQRAVRLADQAGVTLGSGSDLIGPDQQRRGLELALKAQLLDPMRAIVSATATNARLIGMEECLGRIAPDFLADLIAVDGDPLADPELFDGSERVVLVIKDGQVVKDTRRS